MARKRHQHASHAYYTHCPFVLHGTLQAPKWIKLVHDQRQSNSQSDEEARVPRQDRIAVGRGQVGIRTPGMPQSSRQCYSRGSFRTKADSTHLLVAFPASKWRWYTPHERSPGNGPRCTLTCANESSTPKLVFNHVFRYRQSRQSVREPQDPHIEIPTSFPNTIHCLCTSAARFIQ